MLFNKGKIVFYISIIIIAGLISPFFVLAEENLPTRLEIIQVCGDGMIQSGNGEVCDPGDPNFNAAEDISTTTTGRPNAVCQDFNDPRTGLPWQSGDLHCRQDCLGYDTNMCYTCGNTSKEAAEECDGADFGGDSCISLGFISGNLICMSNCYLNLMNCQGRAQQGGGGAGTSGGNPGSSSGFNPGSNIPAGTTKVIVKGKAYPNSDVHVLVDGRVLGMIRADSKADFYYETSEVSPGVASFGFWSEDSTGLKSTLLTLTFRVTMGAVTNLSGVYLSPSIELDKKAVKQGEVVKAYGTAAPESGVNVHFNSEEEYVVKTTSAGDGKWALDFNTKPLKDEEYHTAKALFTSALSGTEVKSAFSRSITFHVGRPATAPPCPEADLNKDKRVNITDFSILLFYWGTNNSCADQNQNGKVDLVDFSIMMYYWTG